MLQLLAGPKEHDPFRRHLDLFGGPWASPDARLATANAERAEATDEHGLALAQTIRNGIDDYVDNACCDV
jgi:hypothetical protein